MELDWTTILVAIVPAVLTGLISGFASYFSATSKAKNEIKKAKVEQETAIKTIEKQAQYEIEKIRTNAQHEIEMYKARIEADSQKTESDLMSGLVHDFIRDAMKNPQQSKKMLKELQGFEETMREFSSERK